MFVKTEEETDESESVEVEYEGTGGPSIETENLKL